MRRKIKEGNLRNVFVLIRKIRAMAMNQQGYISGETLVDYNNPQGTLVIGTWQSMEDWMNWKENQLRKEIEVQLEELLDEPTEYEVFVYSKHHLKITGDSSLGST
ncbi:MAG: antibiotic biosynthesis monooxygenase [Desulfobacterium sp.]|nr:antibiotic biosynthesis monooxygenase [Desulfobacterium sp.]